MYVSNDPAHGLHEEAFNRERQLLRFRYSNLIRRFYFTFTP